MTLEAAGVSQSIQNIVLKAQAENIPRKIVIAGTYENGKTIVDEVPELSLNSSVTGSIYGFGSMLHRLHLEAEMGSAGIQTYIQPQAEVAGSAADGEVDFTGSSGVLSGTLSFYIGFDLIRVSVFDSDTPTLLGGKLANAINADESLNFTAANLAGVVTLTSKTIGVYGNFAKFSINREPGQKTPAGIVVAITQPTGGAGLPDIQDALDGLGTGDASNELHFTALIHGYGQDSTTLDAIKNYVGVGDEVVGLYDKDVARPFYSITGDTGAGSAGLSDLLDIGALRTTDRANSIFPVPGSKSHPSEIGAQVVGHIERIANIRPAECYTDTELIRIDPGDSAERWTNDRDDRTIAKQNGISSSLVEAGVVLIKDTITLYHPNTIPVNSNIYRQIANICKIQNMLDSLKVTYKSPTFKGAIIVQDANKVGSAIVRLKVIDEDIVRGVLFGLIDSWVDNAWIFESSFAKKNLVVALREATDGFNSITKAILSGVGESYDNQILADTSTAILG